MTWYRVQRCHPAAVALADRHYSRQTVGATEFMPPGKTLVLVDTVTSCAGAVGGFILRGWEDTDSKRFVEANKEDS